MNSSPLPETFLSSLKESIITEHNRLRQNPKKYIPILEQHIHYFNKNLFTKPGTNTAIITQEGPTALQNAIEFLRKQKPIFPLTYDVPLSNASQSHADDISVNGIDGPIGSDGKSNEDRVNNYVKWDKAIAENIDFGNRTAEDVMLSLLIDDGDEERVHRNVMFNKQLKYFGVGVSEHKEYGICVVIDYIGQIDGYVDKKLDNEFQKMKSEENKSLNNNNNTTLKLKLGSEFYKKNKQVQSDTEIVDVLMNRAQMKEMRKAKTINSNINNNNKNINDDPDAPEGYISYSKETNKEDIDANKSIIKTIKIYTMQDGSEQTITEEEIIYK
jgi:uncharacterized protein YkwD